MVSDDEMTGRAYMIYELKHIDVSLIRFSATEDTSTPEIKILWKNETEKALFPLDLSPDEEGLARVSKGLSINDCY